MGGVPVGSNARNTDSELVAPKMRRHHMKLLATTPLQNLHCQKTCRLLCIHPGILAESAKHPPVAEHRTIIYEMPLAIHWARQQRPTHNLERDTPDTQHTPGTRASSNN